MAAYPVRSLAEYLLDRFLGKFIHRIDLKKDGTTFSKADSTLTLPDLNLDCRVLNEGMAKSPIKFVKFRIGKLTIKIIEVWGGKVQILVKNVQVDFQIQDDIESFPDEVTVPTEQSKKTFEGLKEKAKKLEYKNKQKERFLVDALLQNVLINLDVQLENLAIRIVTREAKSMDEQIPTFLIRTNAISFKNQDANNQVQRNPATLVDDLQCLLAGKKFGISDVSVHLMREKWLDATEYQKPGVFSSRINYETSMFPFEYPFLNHPSTIILIKAPFGPKEADQVQSEKIVKMTDTYQFLPSFSMTFTQQRPGVLNCDADLPLCEVQLSTGQLVQILKFMKKNVPNQVTQPKKPSPNLNQNNPFKAAAPNLQARQNFEPMQPKVIDSQSTINMASSTEDDYEQVKADFATQVLLHNPNLMKSMHELYYSQHQIQLLESTETSQMMGQSIPNEGAIQPHLIGKGDGFSNTSALQDSLHPDLLPTFQSNIHPQTYEELQQNQQEQLPQKQRLTEFTLHFTLGQFLASILCSEDDKNSTRNASHDELNDEIEKLIIEQAADLAISGDMDDDNYIEASPFVDEHDRIFKAFGEQVNQQFPLQKFHMPDKRDNGDDIKSSNYEFSVNQVEGRFQLKLKDGVKQCMTMQAGVKSVYLHRCDVLLKKEGTLKKPSNTMTDTHMNMTLISDDSSQFHSCMQMNLSSTNYHDAQEVQLEESHVEIISHSGIPSNLKNVFQFTQLTNVVPVLSERGDYHVCNKMIFELTNISNEPRYCLTFSSKQQLMDEEKMTYQSKALLKSGKTFVNITASEILLALALRLPPTMDPTVDNTSPASQQSDNPKTLKETFNLSVEGLEFDFQFAVDQRDVLELYSALGERNHSIQKSFAYLRCQCEIDKKEETSIGLNLLQMEFQVKTGNRPEFKVKQGDLVSKFMDGEPPVTILSLDNLALQLPLPKTQPKTQSTHQSKMQLRMVYEESKKEDISPSYSTNQGLVFTKRASSDDQPMKHKESNVSNNINQIDQPINNCFEIKIQKISSVLDSRDLSTALVRTLVQTELQVKNLMNVLDISTIQGMDQMVDQELFFLQKRETINEPLKLRIILDELCIQILIEKQCKLEEMPDIKEALKMRFNRVDFTLKMQDRGTLGKIQMDFKAENILILDQMQEIHQNYQIQTQSELQIDQREQDSDVSSTFVPTFNQMTFQEEMEEQNRFLLLHPSTKVHQRPMLSCEINITFINEGFFEERATLEKLQHCLQRINSDKLAIKQVAIDFGEMRKNPMQLVIDLSLNHLAAPVSNQNLTLQKALTKVGDKVKKAMNRQRENDQGMTPFESPAIDLSLQSFQFDMIVKDSTIIYTPVLTREKIEKVYGIAAGHPLVRNPAYDQQLFRVQLQIAVQLNNLQVQSKPSEKLNALKCTSASVYFLNDTSYEKWPSWFLFAQPISKEGQGSKNVKSHQELQRKGFVPILAFADFSLVFKQTVLKVKLSAINVSFAQDSLRDFMNFLKLVQVSITDDLTTIEDAIEQSVNLSASNYTENDQNYKPLVNSLGSNNFSNLTFGEQPHQSFSDEKEEIKSETLFDINNNNPFQHSSDALNEMFTITVNENFDSKQNKTCIKSNPFASGASPASSQNSPSTKKVNLLAMIEPNYFSDRGESQQKIEQRRFRKIHNRSEEEQNIVCAFEFSFEFNSMRVTLFGGKDFDFDDSVQTHQSVITNSQIQTKQNKIPNRTQSVRIPQNNDQELQELDVVGIRDASNQALLKMDGNYMMNSDVQNQTTDFSITRRRKDTRRYNEFLKFEVQDFIVTRRHFPDPVLIQKLKSNKTKIPTEGLKRKTFAVSVRNFQMQHCYKQGQKSLFESPYSFRYHNFLELTIQSQKDYLTDIEDHAILVFLRPTKVTLTKGPVDFLETFLPALQQQKVQNNEQAPFEILEDQRPKTPEAKEKTPKTKQRIRNLVIRSSSLTVSISGVVSKLLTVRDLTIPIQEFRLHNSSLQQLLVMENAPALPIADVQACVIQFYKNDIVNNQKIAILSSFKLVKNLSYFGGSILSPIYKPFYRAYYFGLNGFLVGLSEGFGDLYSYVSEETYDWSIYLLTNMQGTTFI